MPGQWVQVVYETAARHLVYLNKSQDSVVLMLAGASGHYNNKAEKQEHPHVHVHTEPLLGGELESSWLRGGKRPASFPIPLLPIMVPV